MSYSNGPTIVTNGLIFALDAGDRNSYPGSGTTWLNLAGSNNGALTNGPTFSNGAIVFDGINDYISLSNIGYSPGTTGELTLEIWVYPTGPYSNYNDGNVSQLGGFFGQGFFGGSTGWGIGMGNWISPSQLAFSFQVRNGGNVVEPGFTGGSRTVYTNNSWYHVVGTFTRNDFSRIYLNGVLTSSASSTSLNNVSITPSTNNAAIGRINNFYSGCKIAVAKLYNKPLSADEVLQNYNATKGRFGL